MTLRNAQAGHEMARCRVCDHDLRIKRIGNQSSGEVFCLNRNCRHFKEPHRMRDNVSFKGEPPRKAAAR